MTAAGNDIDALLADARKLAADAGCGRPLALAALDGGRNNRVYRVETASGPPLVLKSYFRDARDPRDRRGAEWAFLTHAWFRDVCAVPQPLATDAARGLSLLGFIEGTRLSPGQVTPSHVEAALDLVCAVNAPPCDLSSVLEASEACFSIAQHLATIERRIERLSVLDDSAPLAGEAQRLVSDRLLPAARRATKYVEHELRLGMTIPDVCYSPSDFGFHNALVGADGRVSFIDFEYAGRDDPAKLVCDFFCQPDVPVPLDNEKRVIDRLATGLGLEGGFAQRCRLLLEAYRVKWVCIMLNDFLPGDNARRGFASAAAREERCAAQLAKAHAALDALET